MGKDAIKIRKALKLYSEGRIDESREISMDIYKNTTDSFSKLQAINFLTSSLNKARDIEKLLELCDEGIDLSKKLLRDDIRAQYMAFKAECLIHFCMILNYKMVSLKISPGWTGFSTESEKVEYEKMESEKIKYENEADELFSYAKKIIEDIGDKAILARILKSQGTAYGTWRTTLMVGGMKYSKLFSFLFKNFGIQLVFLFHKKQEIRNATKGCIGLLLKSAEISKSTNNMSEYAYTIYSLVGELNAMGKKMKARKYLKKAEKVSIMLNEKVLINQAYVLRKAMREKSSKDYGKPPVLGV